MRTIIRIANVELKILFYSPIAWLVLIILGAQSAIGLFDSLHNRVIMSLLGRSMNNLTQRTYTGPAGLFMQVQNALILYVPLMTMGVFSRELSSGSIKLPLSSPARILDLVLGKYLALLVYGLGWMVLIGILCLASNGIIVHQDNGLLLSCMLGLYLLVAGYMAIGLFMSSLTPHQLVAAISTMAVFGGLNEIRMLWNDVAFWQDITFFLSVSGRVQSFYNGLISSRDVGYFIIVIVLFLGLVVIRLRNQRDTVSGWIKAARYGFFCVGLITIGYFSGRPTLILYKDMTTTKYRTLTPRALGYVQRLKGPLTIHSYVNVLDVEAGLGMPNGHHYRAQIFEPYQRWLPEIKYAFTYYYDTPVARFMIDKHPDLSLRQLAWMVAHDNHLDTQLILTPQQMRERKDLKDEEYRFVWELSADGRKTFLRTFPSTAPREEHIAAAFRRLVDTIPRIACVTGHGERGIYQGADDQSYKEFMREPYFMYSLTNRGFDVLPLKLSVQDIPADLTALVIADPLTAFSEAELAKLRDYIAHSGNLVLTGEAQHEAAFNSLAAMVGVSYAPGKLVQQSKDYASSYVRGALTPAAARFSVRLAKLKEDSMLMHMADAAAMRFERDGGSTPANRTIPGNPFAADTLAVTDTLTTWQRTSDAITDTGEVRYLPAMGDRRQAFPLALLLHRAVAGRQQHILVTADADWLNNLSTRKSNPDIRTMTANFDVATEMLKACAGDSWPIDVSRPPMPDTNITIGRHAYSVLRILFVGVLPGLVLLAGVIVLVRRMRK